MESVYKKIEVVGTSPNSIEEAVQIAVEKASASVHGMRWFEVVETRGNIQDGKVGQYQVTLKVGFRLE